MGSEQSSESRNSRQPPPQQAGLSQAQMRQLLNEQRQMYERTMQQFENRASRPSPPSALGNPSPPPRSVPSQVPQPTPTRQTAPHLRNPASATNASLERQRAPYNYAQTDLQNVAQQRSQIGVRVGVQVTRSTNLNPIVQPSNIPVPGSSSTTVHVFNFNEHVQTPAPPTRPPQGFVMVDNNGQAERPERPRPPPQSGRDRSISRPRNNANSNRARGGDDELNCPTCHNMYGLQIYQCNSGHSSCKPCKDQRKPCGICGNTINNMRNITLEGYVSERSIPCPNKSDGCMLVIKMADMEFHLKECPFNELQCPLGCHWTGRLKQLSNHFDNQHPQQRTADVGSEIRLQDITNNSQNAYLVLIGVYNFLFHVKVSRAERKVYMSAQLIGTKMSASKWSYEIHVYNKNESRRKYTWVDQCTSYHEPVAEIFNKGNCSVLSNDHATTFFNNGALTYKFYIRKTVESRPRGDFGRNQRGRGRC